jgi:hypothetical protein
MKCVRTLCVERRERENDETHYEFNAGAVSQCLRV